MGKYFLFLFILSLTFISCSDNSTSFLPTGSICGFVKLYHENRSFYSNFTGAKVQVEGTNHFAITDSSGRYTIEDVPPGIYNIVFSKEGFCIYKMVSKEFSGGGKAYYPTIYLYELTTLTLSTFDISIDTNYYSEYKISGTVPDSQNYYRGIVIFFGHKNVSPDPADYLTLCAAGVFANKLDFLTYMRNDDFLNNGFNLGDSVYALAYPISGFSNYPDPKTGRNYFSGLGKKPLRKAFLLQ